MAYFGMNRNGSGYFDSTAYKAIMGMAKAGDIWTVDNGREEVLILKNQGTFCNCLSLMDMCRDDQCIEINSAGMMYTNPGMVKYVFNQRLGAYVQRLPDDEFQKVREAVAETLGFGWKAAIRRKEAHDLLDMILDRAGGL